MGSSKSSFKVAAGLRLQAARRATRMSQGSFAKLLGLGQSTVSSHETGARGFSAEEAVNYAKAASVSPGWLMFGEDAQAVVEPPVLTFKPFSWVECVRPQRLADGATAQVGAAYFVLEVWEPEELGQCSDHGPACKAHGLALCGVGSDDELFCAADFRPLPEETGAHLAQTFGRGLPLKPRTV